MSDTIYTVFLPVDRSDPREPVRREVVQTARSATIYAHYPQRTFEVMSAPAESVDLAMILGRCMSIGQRIVRCP